MPKQLSRCCKAEIELTGEDRPNHFKCNECDRIIGEPYELKYLSCYDEPHTLGQAVGKINELIDAVNKLQEHREGQKKENSLVYEEIENIKSCLQTPAVDNHTIDSLLLQVSQQQEAIDDIKLQISKLWNTITSNGHYMECGERIGKIHSRPMDTTTDTNVGAKIGNTDFSKISYSKEAVEQEAEKLLRENEERHQIKDFGFRKGIKYALDYMEGLLRGDPKSELYELTNYEYIVYIRKQKMEELAKKF